ncbi:NAD(P)H-hydrate dehydratase, partial [Salmonella enterica]
QQEWGKSALAKVRQCDKPMLWDADALNLLAIAPDTSHNRILTPHPGEAARLLNRSVAEIESDRLLSARELAQRYGGCVVLKGAGTVVTGPQDECGIIDAGNPGMGTG